MSDKGFVHHGKTSHAIGDKCQFCDSVRTSFHSDFARFNWDVIDFLRESNNIENEWDDLSLQQAIYAWDTIVGEEEITPGIILKVHKILMLHHLRGDQKGYFRREPVYVGGREGKPWFVIPELVENWCARVNSFIKEKANSEDVVYLEKIVQEDHVDYEKIHPFIDGNGRTGRIFMNWERAKLGLPINIIKNDEKQEYYKWFRE
jgi:Fic family protein